MLLSHGGDYAYFRVHQTADFPHVAPLFGAHFDNEYLMIRFELFAHGAHYAQRRVVAARGHQHVVLFGEYPVQIVLGAGLAVAARNAYHGEFRHAAQDASGVVAVVSVYEFFERQKNPQGGERENGAQCRCGHGVCGRYGYRRKEHHGSGQNQKQQFHDVDARCAGGEH